MYSFFDEKINITLVFNNSCIKGAKIPKVKITDFTAIRIALALKGLQTQPGTFLTDKLGAIR